jgi:hypothetical protein
VSFKEFWPRYLAAHGDPRTRLFHKLWLAAAAPAAGYGPAWLSHAVFERNRPETFRAPFASLAADFVMTYHVLRGTIDAERG